MFKPGVSEYLNAICKKELSTMATNIVRNFAWVADCELTELKQALQKASDEGILQNMPQMGRVCFKEICNFFNLNGEYKTVEYKHKFDFEKAWKDLQK